MEIWEDRQKNPVADEVSALVAVARSVITGVLRSVSAAGAAMSNERDKLPLKMLGRIRKEADGDCGIAFEYAVHHSVASHEPLFSERIADALNKCGIGGRDPVSILFAVEKSGSQELISTEPALVTDSSPVLLGEGGRPVSLQDHLSAIGAAFRLPNALLNLKQSIRGLWKTELFLGSAELDKWVGVSVSTGQQWPAAAREPRIAVIPVTAGGSDLITLDEQNNTVLCPIPHDGSFMRIFHDGWKIVQTLCARDFEMPNDAEIPNPLHREVARIFVERREFPIIEVVEATQKFAQQELLSIRTEIVPHAPFRTTATATTSTIITPIASTSAAFGANTALAEHRDS
jgi:hypothetical protein